MKIENYKIVKFLLSTLLVTSVVFVFANVALAAVDTGVDTVGQSTGLGNGDVRLIIGNVIKVALGFLGAIALIFVLYGGFMYMTAGGAKAAAGGTDKTTQAKKIIINAVIGLVIIFCSYAIASFVINSLNDATGGASGSGSFGDDSGSLIVSGGNVLVSNSITPQGNLMVNNVKVRVLFSRSVDSASITADSVLIKKSDGGSIVSGAFVVSGREVVFTPDGKCVAPHTDANCFDPNATFSVTLKPELIRSANGGLSLTCAAGSACAATFTTGALFDSTAPTVNFISPLNNARVSIDSMVEGLVSADDDSGVSTVSVSVDGQLLKTAMPVGGFSQTFTSNFEWDTAAALVALGTHTLQAKAKDIDSHETTAQIKVKVLPVSCFDGSGALICGAQECGLCDDSACTRDDQCASGFCQIPPGICATLPTITSIAPTEAGVGSFVSIFGFGFKAFSAGKSKVYFSNGSSQYIEAGLGCSDRSGWSDTQIIAKVPSGAGTGPIKIINKDDKYDTTSNDRGWKGEFTVDNTLKNPGLCSVLRDSCDANCTAGLVGQVVSATGENFGVAGNATHVYFGTVPADLSGTGNWADARISGVTIPSILSGLTNVVVGTGTRCLDNNNSVCSYGDGNCTCTDIYSNPIQFRINNPVNLPTIGSIAPNPGPAKQMVTIAGANFGNSVGRVVFVSRADDSQHAADLPCSASGWSDDQVVVKVPADLTGDKLGSYDVFVYTANNRASGSKEYVVNDATAKPGICSLAPDNGPVGTMIKIGGESLGSGTQYSINFKKTINTTTPAAGFSAWSDTSIDDVLVPSDAVSGSVYLQSNSGPTVISNKLQFKVGSCKADADCTEGHVCCGNGICLPKSGTQTKAQVCQGQVSFIPSEFGWVLSTGILPKIPHVLERSCVTGYLSQSPSPLKGSQDACPNGTISAAFNMLMDETSLNNKIIVKRCEDANATCDLNACPTTNNSTTNCLKTTITSLTNSDLVPTNLHIGACTKDGVACQPGSGDDCVCHPSVLVTQFSLADSLADGAVADGLFEIVGTGPASRYELMKNTWYQVEITGGTDGVKSVGNEKMSNSYKWSFKTKATDCVPDSLLMTPAAGLISALNGLEPYLVSGQYKCQNIALRDKPWQWDFETATNKAEVKGYGCSGNGQYCSATDADKRLDIGVYGVKANQINPDGSAKIDLETPSGVPLRIEANAPGIGGNVALNKAADLEIRFPSAKVISYFPNCQAACSNAMIGADFSVAMRPSDFNATNIKLYACASEANCTTPTPSAAIDLQNNATVRYQASAKELQIIMHPTSYLTSGQSYRVVIKNVSSASGSALASLNFHSPETNGTMLDSFSWVFKTKVGGACQIDNVTVQPEDYVSKTKGEQVEYLSVPRSAPDECDSRGQALDPFAYSWLWNSSQSVVASITNHTTNINRLPYCSAKCLLTGSQAPAVCGNGVVESGEQCDGGTNCNGKCLYQGFPTCTKILTTNCCGNKILENGEQCEVLSCDSSCKASDIVGTPILYYSLDKGAPSEGTVKGAVPTVNRNGEPDRSQLFNGSNDYIDAGRASGLDVKDAVTVAAWIKHSSGNGQIVNRGGGWSEDGYSIWFLGGTLRVELQNRSRNAHVLVDNVAPSNNAWHHVAFTWDKTSGQVTVYVDGAEQPNKGMFAESIGTPTQNLNIGRDVITGNYFNGAIDDVLLYNKRLTAGQIHDIFTGAAYHCQCSLPAWCSAKCLNLGSSSDYGSVCGDGTTGRGEDSACEAGGSGTNGSPYQTATIPSNINIKARPDIFVFNQSTGVTVGSTLVSAVEAVSGKNNRGVLSYETNECVATPISLSLSSSSPINNQADVCRNALVYLTFSGQVQSANITSSNVKFYKMINPGIGESCNATTGGGGSGAGMWDKIKYAVTNFIFKTVLAVQTQCSMEHADKFWVDPNGLMHITVAPGELLDVNRTYRVVLTGIKNRCGQTVADKTITFTAGNKVCMLNNVSVDPADVTVTKADQTSEYQAFGRSDSQVIQPFTG
ncbi:MAG: LamG-like jellyroll fold domain-containing protein, partial [Parcubacteria group bacterium]